MAEQLIRKNGIEVFPWVNLSDIVDSKTGVLLTTILERCNHIYLDYKISSGETKLLIPSQLRHQGLWVSYQGYSGALVTEWYNVTDYSDDEWKKAENWVSYTKAIETALAAAETADEATENLTSAINTAAEAAESAEKAAEQAAQAVSDANTAKETATTATASLNEVIATANSTISTCNSTIESAETTIENTTTAISEANTVISSSEEAISNTKEAIADVEEAIEDATESSENVQSITEACENAITEASSVVDDVTNKIAEAETTISELEEATENANSAADSLGETVGAWAYEIVNWLGDIEITDDLYATLWGCLSLKYAWLEWDADYTCTGYTSDDVPTTLNTWKGTSGSTALTDLTRLWAVNMSAGTSMYYAFRYQTALEELDLRGLDTSSVTTMQSTFSTCSSLTSLDVSNWDTSSVTNMQSTFYNCTSLTSLDVSNWDTSSVTTMHATFYNCTSLTSLDVSNWDTSSVTTLYSTFNYCSSLTSLDVSNWDTSSVTNMQSTFSNCTSLTSLDVSNWDTSSVTTMSSIFAGCSSLTSLDVSSWDTSSVTSISSAFDSVNSLTTIDLSPWDGSAMTNITGLIKGNIAVELLILPSNLSKITSLANLSYAHYTTFGTRRGTPCLVEIDLNDADCSNVTTFGSAWYTGMMGEGNSFNGFNGIMDCSSITGGTIAVSVNGYSYKVFYYWKIKNLGKASALTSLSFSNIPYYGKDVDGTWHDGTSWNGLESLQYTLANLYDRASAGYSTCTLYFCSYGTYTYITDEELADAVEKGYTVAASS